MIIHNVKTFIKIIKHLRVILSLISAYDLKASVP